MKKPKVNRCPRCLNPFTIPPAQDCHSLHYTYYEETEGEKEAIGALCESCWSKLTPQKRLPYYIRLFHRWMKTAFSSRDIHITLPREDSLKFDDDTLLSYAEDTWAEAVRAAQNMRRKWPLIKSAVRAGK